MWGLPTTAPALSSALIVSDRLVAVLKIRGIQGRCRGSSHSPSGTSSLTPSIDQQPTETRQVTMWQLPTTAPVLSSALMISARLVVLLRIHGIQGRCRWSSHSPSAALPALQGLISSQQIAVRAQYSEYLQRGVLPLALS